MSQAHVTGNDNAIKPEAKVSQTSFTAILFQKTEHIVGPYRAPQVGKAMPLLVGLAKRRINSHLEFLSEALHCGGENATWCKIVIIFWLEKENLVHAHSGPRASSRRTRAHVASANSTRRRMGSIRSARTRTRWPSFQMRARFPRPATMAWS